METERWKQNDGSISDGSMNDGSISDGSISDGSMTDGSMNDGNRTMAAPQLSVQVEKRSTLTSSCALEMVTGSIGRASVSIEARDILS